MSDTSPEIQKKFHEMLMSKSGAERMDMGASMFETARTIVLASLPEDLPTSELKRRLFKRIYGREIEESIKQVRDGRET